MVETSTVKSGSEEQNMEPMMVNRDMTPADVAAVVGDNNRNDDWGGGAWWIVVLFLFMFCNGGWNRGGSGEPVTEAGLCDAMNFTQNALGQANLAQQISETSCATQRAIDGVNYNLATQAACINQSTTEQTQKVLDAITGNRMAEMQNQINQLQLNEALCGVVRYPNGTTYTAGVNPYFAPQSCGCATPTF